MKQLVEVAVGASNGTVIKTSVDTPTMGCGVGNSDFNASQASIHLVIGIPKEDASAAIARVAEALKQSTVLPGLAAGDVTTEAGDEPAVHLTHQGFGIEAKFYEGTGILIDAGGPCRS